MAGSRVQKFQSGSLAKTIDVHLPDFQEDIQYDGTTVNVTSGLNEGIGPRYGFSPIPGQMDAEAVATGNFAGLLKAETSWVGSSTRQNIYAIIPLVLGGCDSAANLANKQLYYAVVLGHLTYAFSGKLLLDVVFLGTNFTSTNVIMQQSPYIYSGLGYPGTEDYTSIPIFAELLQTNLAYDPYYITAIANLGTILGSTTFVAATAFSVSNPEIDNNWVAGVTSYGSANGATTAPSIECLTPYTFSYPSQSRTAQAFFGVPSDPVTGNFTTGQHTVTVYALTSVGAQNIDYSASFLASTSIFQPNFNFEQILNPEINLSSVTASKTTSGTSYGSTVVALINDPLLNTNASYKGVLVAAGKAFCIIAQDWLRSYGGRLQQYVDLTNVSYNPQPIKSSYTENGTTVPTAFGYWPTFTANTAMPSTGTVALNAANSGILRANTLYEFSYSVYNKRLNFETNVGPGVQFLTGTADFVSIQLYDNATSTYTTQLQYLLEAGNALVPWPGQFEVNDIPPAAGTNNYSVNHLEYRFYYRQSGMSEWLPALFIDAAQWWFYPHFVNLSACTGGIGGLPGGRPGGYSDYSQLPADSYNCVVMFKNRAFWSSSSNLCFSRQNNIFAYPTGNSASCPAGSYKGMMVATYYGQAQQQARLVVFTTEGTYIGLFTGNPTDIPVQVSATSIGSYPLDGSDFQLNAWTSITAFSYRAAANCEGLLYFWGPQGVFVDDGVDPITRISPPLEPDIFQFYDPSKTDDIHCVYNNNTKEIIWFYPPKVADNDYPTYALIFNRQRQTWLYAKYPGQVDASQALNIRSSLVPTGGSRTVVYSRESPSSVIQRAYFYDERNLAGDIFPSKELMIKAVSSPTSSTRQLTLAAGYTGSVIDTISVGDVLTLQQTNQYATSLTEPSDFTAVITAINTGSGLITLELPEGATLDSSWTAATNNLFFPVYHAAAAYNTAQNATLVSGPGINGFAYQISTKYWIPQGITFWGYWLWYHLLFKLRLLLPSGAANNVTFAHRTPVSNVGYVSKTLTINNNSDSNFQAFVQLLLGNQNLEGQGVRIQLSGIQIGGSWVLQSINGQSAPIDGDQLKLFEA
jgi:hypothetical protein